MVDCEEKSEDPVKSELLALFPKLYSSDAKARQSSASQLLEIISKEKNLGENFIFVVDRLIKATTRSRDARKIGATILLTEILRSFPDFRVSLFLDMCKKIIGEVNDNLHADGVTAWTLIFTSIVQSNRLDVSEKKTFKELIRFMAQLGDKKRSSNIAICNLFEMLFEHQFDADAFSSILQSSLKLNEHGNDPLFQLYLILLIHKHPELSRVLYRIPTADLDDPENLNEHIKTSINYYPKIHPACIELFRFIDKNDRMDSFWETVYSDFFDLGSSFKFHHIGLSLICTILPDLSDTNAGYIFSKKMMDLWMKCLSNRNHRLHSEAWQLSLNLQTNYDNYDPKLQVKVISLLTESPGTVSFDELTQTRTVSPLYVSTKAEAVQELIDHIIEKIRSYVVRGASARDKMRLLYVGQLREFIKSSHITDSPEIKLSVMNFFLSHGYFDVSEDETLSLASPVTEPLMKKIKVLFFKLIILSCNCDILEGIGLHALGLIKKGIPLKDDKAAPLWKKMKKMKIKFKKVKSEGEHEKQLSIFKPLFYGIAISSLQDDNDIDLLISNFDELLECYKRSLGDNEAENEPNWPDVLLDLMISQFSAQSSFLSHVMVKAFKNVVSDVTLEGLEQLKIALLAEQIENEEEGDANDVTEEGEEEDENGEKMDEDSDDDSDGMDEDDEDADVDDEFKAKVTLALGPAVATGDENEAQIDDEEMFQLDEALAEAFRSKYSMNKHTQASLKILRSKCLDVVEIILRSKEHSLEVILFLVPVLVDAIKLYSRLKDADLRARVGKLFTYLVGIKSFTSYDAFNTKIAQGLFKKGIDMAAKMDDIYLQTSAARLCVWTMSLSKHINLNTDWALDHLLKLLREYFTKPNSCVSKDFFMIIFQNHKVFNSQILEALSKSVFVNLRPFKKLGGLALITAYLRLCQSDIVEDESIKTCLKSIRKDAVTGLMSAINSTRAALTNEYLCLLATLGKFIPLDLAKQEVRAIDAMNGPVKSNLSKAGKSARSKILSSIDKHVLKESRHEEKKDEEGEIEKSNEQSEMSESKARMSESDEEEAKVENGNDKSKNSPAKTPIKEVEVENKKPKKSRKSLVKTPVSGSKNQEKKVEKANETSEKAESKSPMTENGSEEEENKVGNGNEQSKKSPASSPIKSPVKSLVNSPVKSPIKSPVESPVKSPTKSPVNSPVKIPSKSPSKSWKMVSKTSTMDSEDEDENVENGNEVSEQPAPKTPTMEIEKEEKKVKSSAKNSIEKREKSPLKTPLIVVKRLKFESPSESEDHDSSSPRVTRAHVKTPRATPQIVKPEQETAEERSEADDEPTTSCVPVSEQSELKTVEGEKEEDEVQNGSEKSEKSPSKSPSPSPMMESERKDKGEKSKSPETVEDEHVVKKLKFESPSESDTQEATSSRVTRARVKTPRAAPQIIKPEPETAEERSEADDELTHTFVPRVQLIKTPATRSRTRSATPTKEPVTPLRRSARTRK